MRYIPIKHQPGTTRIRERFLLFPKCIDGEWRWLEHAVWCEELTTVMCVVLHTMNRNKWIAVRWS